MAADRNASELETRSPETQKRSLALQVDLASATRPTAPCPWFPGRRHCPPWAESNGMDSSPPSASKSARLEMRVTSPQRGGVRHEAYAHWSRHRQAGVPVARHGSVRADRLAAASATGALVAGVARGG